MKGKRFRYHVFLSHNGAQKDWTRRLAARLRDAGLSVFFDEDSISLGEDLAAAIERGLKSSRHVLLVLSPEALASGWVALEYSASLYKDPAAADRFLIPILRADCEIPLVLGRLKHLDARGEDFDKQVNHLLNGIERVEVDSPVVSRQAEKPVTLLKEQAQHSAEAERLLTLSMPVRPGAQSFYVERDADLKARRSIEANNLLLISGPRKIGKTSLLFRMCEFAESIGKKPAFIDLQMFGSGTSEPQLYYELSLRLSKKLEIPEPEAKNFLGSPGRAFLDFMSRIEAGAVIIIDEFDMLKGIGILEEFSSILRAFHQQTAIMDSDPPGMLISSCLPPYRFIENTMMSPFNIGTQLRLAGFDRREAETLIRRVFPALPVRDADKLYELVGGQPFLLQCGLHWLSQGHAVNDLELVAASSESPFSTYLEFLGHSIGEKLRRDLSNGDLSTISGSALVRLEEMGVLSKGHTGHEWVGKIHEIAFGKVI